MAEVEEVTGRVLVSETIYTSFAAAWLGSICMGTSLGYSSPAVSSLLEQAKEEEDEVRLLLRPDDTFWFGSLLNMGALFGCYFGGALCQAVGRLRALSFCCLGFILSWLALAYAGQRIVLYVGRVCTGFFTGIVSVVVPAYVSELSPEDSRALYGGTIQLAITFGIFVSYLIGTFFDWSNLALSMVVPPAIMMPFLQVAVESPRWQMATHKRAEAIAGMREIRPADAAVDDELLVIEATYLNIPTPRVHIAVAVLIMFLQQFSGINSIIFYAGATFSDAGVNLSPDALASLLAALQVSVTMTAVALLDSMGRRTMLVLSSLICSITLAVMASAELLGSDTGGTFVRKIGPVTVAIYVIGFSLGMGPVTWITCAELVPCRALGLEWSSIAAFNWGCSFMVTVLFDSFKGTVSRGSFYIFFCIMTLVNTLMIYISLPETSKLSIEQILLQGYQGEEAQAGLMQAVGVRGGRSQKGALFR
ncbi:uncharacterized protein LOC135395335 [Ornithodoros turicata]|uniref:uncharacterized protein LOC135395335 n=1 Tax=Ornithodoros turicata TaxID=34597 RepID=UPI003138826D